MDEEKNYATNIWSIPKLSTYPGIVCNATTWIITKFPTYSGMVCNALFEPSWANKIAGYTPFIGNLVLLGSAAHAYIHKEYSYGHEKLLQAAIGISIDSVFAGTATEGLKLVNLGLQSCNTNLQISGAKILVINIVARTMGRVSVFDFIESLRNKPFHSYM